MKTLLAFAFLFICGLNTPAVSPTSGEVTRVFIFAGQSNMEGADSNVADIKRFPPFAGLEQPQKRVKFSYSLGRENKKSSNGWGELQAIDGVVGPELSFARKVTRNIDAPIAIIKCAAGGTHLGGDWNPDTPSGFEMYPLALDLIRSSLLALKKKGIRYRIEGFMWHQGENDMFEDEYQENYGTNLRNFVAKLRRDLETPNLRFYIGELCTKTIWGMDLRPRMYAIRQGQESVTNSDPLADYVRTSHVAVEIGGGVGLHYHYGTLGQLEHGVNYADAYLATLGLRDEPRPALKTWPHKQGETIQLFVLAGHRNMEGERAFVQELPKLRRGKAVQKDMARVPYKYNIGGGAKVSNDWEALGPAGYYDTFGPELSFGRMLHKKLRKPLAIAKFTHSGSQIIDWTPAGSETKDRNLYPRFLSFIRDSMEELKAKGNPVELAGIFYHVGENDMSFYPYREQAASRLQSLVQASRADLDLPSLRWFVSQQPPTDHEQVSKLDVTAAIAKLAAADEDLVHIQAFSLPEQDKQLVLDTAAIVKLGEQLAKVYLKQK